MKIKPHTPRPEELSPHNILFQYPCGCAVMRDDNEKYFISYCATHKIASELLEALKQVEILIRVNARLHDGCNTHKAIEKLLAKAEVENEK